MSLLDSIVVILCLALIVLSILHYLKLPSIVGYLLLGVVLGPYGYRLIYDTHITTELAEFGVVFLLFTIGMEFSLSKLIKLKRFVFVFGSIQVSLMLLITALAARLLGLSSIQSIIIGAVASLSSTAIVSKLLTEQDELSLPHGQRAIGILLFQDLAVIPLMILIANLSSPNFSAVLWDIFLALGKGIIAIVLIIALSQKGLRPLFNQVAKTKSLELFTLTILVVTLSASWLTNYLGLSFALGAFLAGIMLGETEFRHQIAIDIRPFRDVLLGVFFISIGFLIDIHSILTHWQWVTLFVLAVMGLKFVIILLFCWRGKPEKFVVASQTAIVLAQGGEFSLVLLNLALAKQLIPEPYAQVMLFGIFISMLITPVLIRHNIKLVKMIIDSGWFLTAYQSEPETQLAFHDSIRDHVLILGFGRVGHRLSQFANNQSIPYVALDLSIERVKLAKKEGFSVFYGDACNEQILKSCYVDRARSVIISFYHDDFTESIIRNIKKLAPHVSIVARCFDETQAEYLYQLGADTVIPETIEMSLMLAFHLLLQFETPVNQAWSMVEQIRRSHYADYEW